VSLEFHPGEPPPETSGDDPAKPDPQS